PALNGGQLRLYQNATKGGSIKIYAKNNAVITKVVVYASGSDGDGPAGYSVDNTTEVGTWPDGTTIYTMNNLTATDYVEFYNKGTSGSTRTYVDYFEVTYESAPTCTTPEFLFDEEVVNKIVIDEPFTNEFISDNTSAFVWSSTDTDVATVDA